MRIHLVKRHFYGLDPLDFRYIVNAVQFSVFQNRYLHRINDECAAETKLYFDLGLIVVVGRLNR